VAIGYFLKPETNKGDFRLYFELFEKSCRGRHHSEISKKNTKNLDLFYMVPPPGHRGWKGRFNKFSKNIFSKRVFLD
jgi:hypothetical protein